MKRKKKYTFKPNRNTFFVLLVIVVLIILGTRSCTRFDKSIRGAKYEETHVILPQYQIRECKDIDGNPTADHFKIYPPKENDKVVYLTFDDGPSPNITPQILDVLKKYNVKATFFVVTQNAEKYPDVVRRAAQEGHSIAYHSYSHNYNYIFESLDTFRDEINKSRTVLTSILGENGFVDIFRFPGGAFKNQKNEFKEVLIEENISYVNWNCLTGDTESKNPVSADLITRAKNSVAKAGSDSLVMLMHDAGAKQASADALPAIIEHLQNEGFRFDSLRRY
ncbi:MAG: polysaccharide deacetylase [Clostridia bacterium]|nr:polysaccharide deacetylase [Clostridia bacterium]